MNAYVVTFPTLVPCVPLPTVWSNYKCRKGNRGYGIIKQHTSFRLLQSQTCSLLVTVATSVALVSWIRMSVAWHFTICFNTLHLLQSDTCSLGIQPLSGPEFEFTPRPWIHEEQACETSCCYLFVASVTFESFRQTGRVEHTAAVTSRYCSTIAIRDVHLCAHVCSTARRLETLQQSQRLQTLPALHYKQACS